MLPQSRHSCLVLPRLSILKYWYAFQSSPVAHPAIARLCPTESPEGIDLVSVGPRPLLLGSFGNATQSLAHSSTSRRSSSLSTSPPARSPPLPSARWSSYTPPHSPVPSFPSPPVLDEVRMLKAQLAASEARVKVLTKEKWEAVDATRRLITNLQNVRAELNKLKASALDEDDATPVVAPPSEGVWFARLTNQPRVESESGSCKPSIELKYPQDQQTLGSKEKDEGTLAVSPSSEAVSVAGSTEELQLPPSMALSIVNHVLSYTARRI